MRDSPCITQEDLFLLRAFTKKIDRAMETGFSQEDRWGHDDLKGYLPWMGPRYGFIGHDRAPLSVFRGEGLVLFLLSRIIQPLLIVECYTGTGYGTAWLAAGHPMASVYTVDDFREGNLGEKGHQQVQQLFKEVELENVTSLYGSIERLKSSLGDRMPDLYFSDGPYGEAPVLGESSVVIRHDDSNGQDKGRSFVFLGGSNFSVMCPTVEQRDSLMAVMEKVFPVERCDA